ncbi:MAG TPA: ABC transporter permease, partial [Segetibacter sp.]
MSAEYNQFKALWSITKASLRSILRSPSTVVFSLGFPLIFILVFGFIGGGGRVSLSIAVDKKSDTLNPVYAALKNQAGIKIVRENEKDLKEDLEKGRITAIVNIQKNGAATPPYIINLKSS